MAAYLIARVEISDAEQYSKYIASAPTVVEQYGGRFVVRGGDVANLEGPASDARWVVVEFPSIDAAKTFYDSPEYTAARGLRAGAAKGEFVVLDGYDPG